MAAVLNGVKNACTFAADATAEVVFDRNTLYYLGKIFEGVNTVTNRVLPVATGIANVISGAELITCAAGVVTFGKELNPQATLLPKLIEDADGKVQVDPNSEAKIERKKNKSPLVYNLEHKPHIAMAKIGFFIVGITSAVRLFEVCSVPILSTISHGLGMIPMLGSALAGVFAHAFYSIGGFALIASHAALVFDSIRYLYLAATDTTKSISKGILQLVARVAALALDFFFIIHVSNPLVMGLAGIGAGTLMVISAVYNWYRSQVKKDEQERLIKLAEQQDRETSNLKLTTKTVEDAVNG